MSVLMRLRGGTGDAKAKPVWRRGGGGPGGRGRKTAEGSALAIWLALTSAKTFAATSKFPPKSVTDVYKRHGGRWDPEMKHWSFALEQQTKLAVALNQLQKGEVS